MSEPTLLHDLLDRAARRHPDAPAVTSGPATLTYRQLQAASHRVADTLTRHGVRRGDRIVVRAGTDALLPALVHGASRIGGVFALVHEQVRDEQLAHVLTDCEPRLLLADDADAGRTAAAHRVPALPLRQLAGGGPDSAAVDGAGDAAPAGGAPLSVDPVCLIYTSGTTALPKAVVSTHAQVVFAAQAIQSRLSYRPTDTVYCPLPLSFDYGMYQVFLAALGGSQVVLGAPAEAGPSLLANLLSTGSTVLAAVPPVAEGLLRLLRRNPQRAPRLRLLTNTGSTMPRWVLDGLRQLLPELRVQLMFGLTECKRVSIADPDEDLRRPDTLGRPLPGTEVFAVDDGGRRLPPGEVGELVVRGPHVMAGYWRRPELTAQRFQREDGLFPRLHTGDYGSVDAAGYIRFSGRRDDVYKQHGFRVSAVEVEAAARRVHGVEGAAVLPPDGDGRDAVLIVTGTADPAQVQQELRAHLEDFKIPTRCLVLPSLPTSRTGKTDKKALRRLVDGQTDERAA